jgi:uncharacterized protein (DUF885 family)
MADSLARERRFLAEIESVARAGLDSDSRLTYDIFRRQRELDVEGLTYPGEFLPVNPFDGPPQQIARAAASLGQQPLATAADYENWLLRIDEYAGWTRQAIANMRDGMRRGYTSPQVLMARMLPLLQGYGEDTAANPFYILLHAAPQTIKDPDGARLAADLGRAVKDRLLPAFRELHDFIQSEYLPRSRQSVALSDLPLGPSWYAYRVKRATGTLLTPHEIHGIGVAEVERLRARMLSLSAGAPPPAAAALDLLSVYQALKLETLAAMPALFSAVPPADFEIRALGPLQGAATPLYYQRAAPDGAATAILYVNTAASAPRPAGARIAGFLREALPGRHYQSALQQARADLPKFRRFGAEPSFDEGWALYALTLGEELGLYHDDDAKKAALLAQLTCAVALVVDTGLHAESWTRARAFDYLHAQLALEEADANLMSDRYVALPGDALACKMGERAIQALRGRAQQSLGARFDIRDFHSEILKDGGMPVDILETKMKLWTETHR